MLKDKTFLAVIPARGGSKRLPRKNLLELDGKPLVSWSIDAAKKSKYIDKTVVSSDDKQILELASKKEVDIIVRPDELSSDTATTFDAIKHAIETISEKYEYLVLLQPTSPLRTEEHIDEAIELLVSKNADAVISVCEVEHSPLWVNTLPENGDMSDFLSDEVKNKRSQDLGTYYRLNGAIYICRTDRLLEDKSFFIKENIFSYKMDRESSIDIDEKVDFEIAKVIKDIYGSK